MSAALIVVPVIFATNLADGLRGDVTVAAWEGPYAVLTRMSSGFCRHISRHRLILTIYLLFTARQIAIFDVDPALVSTALPTLQKLEA
jgi:hypothetical protein